jgi:diketogulonate reductase-like aldo/keto reductase
MENNNAIPPTITLSDGLVIPVMGYGTYKIPDGRESAEAVARAIGAGYRLIDTASLYGNEEGVGQGIRESGVDRGEIVLTTKIWNDEQGHPDTFRAFERSRERLGTDIDLYLIHWPVGKRFVETWKAMNELKERGEVRSIGVSNFHREHLEELEAAGYPLPPINQVEVHPRLNREELGAYCRSRGIVLEAWRPLMNGNIDDVPEVASLAKQHGKTPAQVALRWLVQRGIIPIPKSGTPSRIDENIDIFDFELSDQEMDTMNSLDRGLHLGPTVDSFS